MRWLASFAAPLLLAALTACEPSAHRLLLVDMNLSDPLAVEVIASPWHDAGYQVEYRRFYPHLTRGDLERYRTVVILGGREPQGLSDALTFGDLAILNEWLGPGRDGVIVLAFTSDGAQNPEGTLDRWIMNQWLGSQGAGITIGSQPLDAPAVPLPRSSLDNAGFAPFPAGRNQTLQVRHATQVLARVSSGAGAFVAASRVNDGLIVVTGRNLLGAGGQDPLTRDYLVALARWTRRPAEWANVRAATSPVALKLAGGPRPVAAHPPPLTSPMASDTGAHSAGAGGAIVLPEPSGNTEKPIIPPWIARQGMRVLWTRFTPQSFDSVLGVADVAALNALATVIPVQAINDTLATRYIWKKTVERLQTSSVRWFPAVGLMDVPSPGADELDRHGELRPVVCGTDSLFWRAGLRPVYRTLARLGGAPARTEIIAGVALDLDSAQTYYGGTGFCDSDYRIGIEGAVLDPAERERLLALPPTLRYDSLLERGLLARYYETLQAAVSDRARALRAELRRLRPDLRFAFRADELPADWFSLGLLQGLSSADAPVLLWLRERETGDVLAQYRARGIWALSAVRLEPTRNTFAPNEWNRLRPMVFGDHSGFWLDRAAPDSIGRMIRRAVR